jgi:hypothetical protein
MSDEQVRFRLVLCIPLFSYFSPPPPPSPSYLSLLFYQNLLQLKDVLKFFASKRDLSLEELNAIFDDTKSDL